MPPLTFLTHDEYWEAFNAPVPSYVVYVSDPDNVGVISPSKLFDTMEEALEFYYMSDDNYVMLAELGFGFESEMIS